MDPAPRENALPSASDKAKATQQVDALGHIAGQIAHEINNRLTVVLGNLSLVAYTINGDGDGELKASIDDTLDAAQQIRDKIRRLQEMTAGFAPKKTIHNVGDLLQTALAEWPGNRDACTLALPDAPLPMLEADAGQIARALHNLLDNAAEARADAAVTVAVETAKFPEDAPSSGPAVAIRVTDNAGGIPPDAAGQIFAPYFTTKKHALGVGLTVALAIARRHRGQLTFTPVPDGSCFSLLLPAYRN